MSNVEKGKRFLELIDKQNNLQWSIVVKLSSLIDSQWSSIQLQNELATFVAEHSEITKEINSLEENNSIL